MVPAAKGIPLPSSVQTFVLHHPSFLFSSSIPTSFWTWSLRAGHPNHKMLPLILKQLTFSHFDLNKPHSDSFAPSSQGCRVLQENYKTIPSGHILSPCFLPLRGPQQLLQSIWNTCYFLLHVVICDVAARVDAPSPSLPQCSLSGSTPSIITMSRGKCYLLRASATSHLLSNPTS